ncbi:unnamed protein product [Pseudo-nitzschia multistriata]|uniref:Peptidase A1 domain-containing protein n=1 Tax=Pseudo-nitzschia multistriata TaxID=183589 RepID=A0A448Z2A6_9STRA|nr:unnamed protein product [Pseudo-nitzschia multistriata]
MGTGAAKKTSHSWHRWTMLATALLLQGSATAKGVVQLKLNPRHVELERRRQRERNLHPVATAIEEEDEGQRHNEEQYRRRGKAQQVGALYEGYGTHYIDLWVGTPPQRQTVIVDTGSGITAFPCGACSDCGAPKYHVDALFVEKDSSSFAKSTCASKSDCIMSRSSCSGDKCLVSMAYAEGSRWNAYEAVDRCYVAGPHETPLVAPEGASLEGDDMNPRHAADLAFDMTFGCQTLVTGLFKTQLADGIMGMSNQASTYWSQMFEAQKMGPDRQFALCFSRPVHIAREGTEAGAMTLGGVDTRLHRTPMVYTPNFNTGRATFFSTRIRRMMLRDGKYGTSVQSTADNPNLGLTVLDIDPSILNKGGTIVDSGTTDTYFNSAIGGEFKRVFRKITGREHTNSGLDLTEEEVLALPTILIQLISNDETNGHVDDMFHTPGLAGAMDKPNKSDVILAIPPTHYMEYDEKSKKYTSRFYTTERSGNVLGANAMMGHDIFFDVDTKRIGWAESDCDYTAKVRENGYDFDITGELKKAEAAGTAAKESKECSSISSGAKCQKVEGCTWGWGKCSKVGDAPPKETPEEPKETPAETKETPAEPKPTPAPLTPDYMVQEIPPLRTWVEDHLVAIGSFVVLSLLLCCIYCLFCRSESSRGRYEKASLEPVSIEMRNGNGMRKIQSFQDEPDDDDSHVENGNGSKFRDEPEFEGDFM